MILSIKPAITAGFFIDNQILLATVLENYHKRPYLFTQ